MRSEVADLVVNLTWLGHGLRDLVAQRFAKAFSRLGADGFLSPCRQPFLALSRKHIRVNKVDAYEP
jgi:hypothetical protein